MSLNKQIRKILIENSGNIKIAQLVSLLEKNRVPKTIYENLSSDFIYYVYDEIEKMEDVKILEYSDDLGRDRMKDFIYIKG